MYNGNGGNSGMVVLAQSWHRINRCMEWLAVNLAGYDVAFVLSGMLSTVLSGVSVLSGVREAASRSVHLFASRVAGGSALFEERWRSS